MTGGYNHGNLIKSIVLARGETRQTRPQLLDEAIAGQAAGSELSYQGKEKYKL